MTREREYRPKGGAVERNAKLGAAQLHAERLARRRAAGEQITPASAGKKKKRHGRQ